MAKLEGVEIFAIGKWNGFKFAQDDLKQIAASWAELKSVHKVPLKMGHNNEQNMTDGFPALGWVTNVQMSGDKLIADFEHVPDVVYKAIRSKLYNAVSIELDIDVDYKEKSYPFVLSGVALLGADLPAVNTLKDLSTYTGEEAFSKTRGRVVFSAIKQEVSNMPDDTLKADLEATKKQLKEQSEAMAKFERENAELKAKAEEDKKAEAKAKFEASKKTLTEKLDGLVKEEKLLPAQRETYIARITEDNIEELSATVDILAAGSKQQFAADDEKAKAKKKKEEEEEDGMMSADEKLAAKINKTQLDHKCSFSVARDMVFRSEPKLAREYITMHDHKDNTGRAA